MYHRPEYVVKLLYFYALNQKGAGKTKTMKGGKTPMNVFVMALIAYCLYKRRAAIPVLLKYLWTAIKAVKDAWEDM